MNDISRDCLKVRNRVDDISILQLEAVLWPQTLQSAPGPEDPCLEPFSGGSSALYILTANWRNVAMDSLT